jgi:hypothetical protein
MPCPKCGLEHRGWITCARAKFDAAKAMVVHEPELVVHKEELVVHSGSSQPEVVVHAGSSRHGVYLDVEKRKVYRREWMRMRRALKSSGA